MATRLQQSLHMCDTVTMEDMGSKPRAATALGELKAGALKPWETVHNAARARAALTAWWINACTLKGSKERATRTWAKAPTCTRVQAASPWQARAELCHCPRGCTRQLIPGEGPVCDVCFVETAPQPPCDCGGRCPCYL